MNDFAFLLECWCLKTCLNTLAGFSFVREVFFLITNVLGVCIETHLRYLSGFTLEGI